MIRFNHTIIAVTLFAALFLCSCTEDNKKAENKRLCRDGEYRCAGSERIEMCKDDRWIADRTCKIDEHCVIEPGDGGLVHCKAFVRNEQTVSLPVGSGKNLTEFSNSISGIKDWWACKIYRRLLRLEPVSEEEQKPIVEQKWRIGLSLSEKNSLLLCAFDSWIFSIGQIAKENETFAGWENASITSSQGKKGWEARLDCKERMALAADKRKRLPTTLTAGIYSSAKLYIERDSQIATLAHDDLGLFATLSFREIRNERFEKLSPTLQDHIGRMRQAASVFYLEDNYTTAWKLCLDPVNEDVITSILPNANAYDCDERCRKALSSSEKWLATLARRPKTVFGKEAMMDEIPSELSGDPGHGAIVCMMAAEQASASRKIDREIAPDAKLGQNRLLMLLKHVASDETYVEDLFTLVDNAPDAFGNYLGGLTYGNKDKLRSYMLTRLDKGLDETTLEALPIWALRDRRMATKNLIEGYDEFASNAERRKVILDILGDRASPSTKKFLMKHLGSGETSAEALRSLLRDPAYRSTSLKTGLRLISKIDDESVKALIRELDDSRKNDDPNWPVDPKPALKKLVQKTRNFPIYTDTRKLLMRLENPGWDWPARPYSVDRYVTGAVSGPTMIENRKAAIEDLKRLDEELAVSLYIYARYAPDFSLEPLTDLYSELAKNFPVMHKVTGRVASCNKPKRVGKLAEEVLSRSKR